MTPFWVLGLRLQPPAGSLARYLEEPPTSREDAPWVVLDLNSVFRWVDSAYVGWARGIRVPNPATDPAEFTTCLAIGVTRDELQRVFLGENGLDATLGTTTDDLAIGGWAEILMHRTEDSRKGKYNVVLRGPDIAGRPSFTFTTARTLPRGHRRPITREPSGTAWPGGATGRMPPPTWPEEQMVQRVTTAVRTRRPTGTDVVRRATSRGVLGLSRRASTSFSEPRSKMHTYFLGTIRVGRSRGTRLGGLWARGLGRRQGHGVLGPEPPVSNRVPHVNAWWCSTRYVP